MQSAETTSSQPAPSTNHRYEVKVTPEMVRHSHIEDVLYFVGTFYGLAVLLLVLAARWSARIRDFVERRVRPKFVVAMLYAALLTLVTSALELPLDFYAGYTVPHEFNLSNQSVAAWFGDFGKGLAISLVIGSIVGALALLGMRKIRRWWLALWIGSIPIILLLVVITPLFLDPIFNKFVPLKDAALRQALLDEASRAGIEGSRVYQVDKSKQTKEMNAYVTGLGPSKRIVLWDTTLQKMNRDEILAVMGHEMGHYVLHHLWKGLAFFLIVSFVVLFVAQRLVEWGIRRWGQRWGITSPGDPASLPWLLLVVSIIFFFLTPVLTGRSRHIEHQADQFGLELTHFNEPMASAFLKLAEDSKQVPYPNRFIEFWRYSHPALGRRIEFALQYRPWAEGKPNELWKAK